MDTSWSGSLSTLEAIGRIISAVFVFAFGACVGSFLNVVVYRLPEGLSVVSPPSRCPRCGGRLGWRENLPVLGWLFLRGRCRSCRLPISIQYPLIEAFVGVLFAGLFLLWYVVPNDWALAALRDPWWKAQGFALSWPVFVAVLLLVAGLVAATIIDARTFLIPAEITWTVAGVGLCAHLAQGLLDVAPRARGLEAVVPTADWTGVAIGLGGCIGLVVASILLARGTIPLSYADYDQYVGEDDLLSSYPHARRETMKELLFLLPIGLGIAAALAAVALIGPSEPPPHWLGSVGASMLGLVVGGGLLWAVRILGTLAFGREAMGLGDVHLVAAIGAVLGWKAAAWTFALSPFIGVAYSLVALCLRPLVRLPIREMPLGPHLALAAGFVLLGGAILGPFEAEIAAALPALRQALVEVFG
jgi:leader peptidase (prepilin peptidase)/N-methyltransferase